MAERTEVMVVAINEKKYVVFHCHIKKKYYLCRRMIKQNTDIVK